VVYLSIRYWKCVYLVIGETRLRVAPALIAHFARISKRFHTVSVGLLLRMQMYSKKSVSKALIYAYVPPDDYYYAMLSGIGRYSHHKQDFAGS